MEMPGRVACLALALPAVTIAALGISEWHSHGFMRKMRRKIEARRPPREGGIFVALLPGERVIPIGGIYAWDLGHLYLEDGLLAFEGERTQFSIAAKEIESVSVACGPLGWFRTHAALLRSAQATFSLRLADRGASSRLAKQLVSRIGAWKESASLSPEDRPAPQLPKLRATNASRPRLVWVFAKNTALMAIGAGLATHIAVGYALASRVVPVAAGMIYLLVVFPSILRRRNA